MVSYDKAYFLDRFAETETDALLERALLAELSPEAQAAIGEILQQRGVTGHALELREHDVRKALLRRAGATNQCDFCGRSGGLFTSLFGGWVRDGGQKFCNATCRDRARLFEDSIDLPADVIVEHARELRYADCPVCAKSRPPLEMHAAHLIVSAIWFVHANQEPALSCRACARRRNLRAALLSFLFGWWSLPGLFATPLMIYRNVRAMREPDPALPSRELMLQARLDLAARFRHAGVTGALRVPPRSGGALTSP